MHTTIIWSETNMNDLLVPLHNYHHKLIRDIDDAEWMSDFERADMLKREEEDVKSMLLDCEVWMPLW